MVDLNPKRSDEEKEKLKKLISIALKYKEEDDAPRVTAMGKGRAAEQIIKIAKEHGIEVRKDEQLAQILSVMDIDDFIPFEAYAAVSEILAYVYKKNAKMRSS